MGRHVLAMAAGTLGILGVLACGQGPGGLEPGSGGGGGGAFSGAGGESQQGGGPAGRDFAIDGSPDSQPLADVACEGADPTALSFSRHRPRARGGFASAQYALSSLASGHWPDPTALRVEDFQRYFGDRVPVSNGALLDARLHASTADDNSVSLDVSVRLAPSASRPALHLVIVADVSESASGSLEARNGALDAIASAVDAHPADTLSLVVFGSPAEVLIERAPQGKALATLEEKRADLYPRPTSDLIGGISAGVALAKEAESTHVLVITDGGTKWDDSIRGVVEGAAQRGIVTSIAQIARDGSEASPTLNDALLEGVADAGMGTRLYFGGSQASPIFQERYEEVMSIASPSATLGLTFPAGLKVVGGDTGAVDGAPVGYTRRFGADVTLAPDCADVFAADQIASMIVDVVASDGHVLASGHLPLAYADAVNAADVSSVLDGAITKVVIALRSRDAAALDDAHALVSEIAGCEAGDCSVADECCVRAELLSLLESTCSLFAQTVPPQFCGAL